MKKTLPIALVVMLAFCCSVAKADFTTVFFGDITLGPEGSGNEFSVPMDGTIGGDLESVEILFDYLDSQDGSWSSDYYFLITDPSGDTIGFGDGLGDGDISYDAGVGTGTDGSPNGSTTGGSFGTLFDISLATAVNPNFGEAGTYTIIVTDGWTGGGDETLFGVTVNLEYSQQIPEPTSAIACLGLAAFGLIRRRRS